MENKQVLDTVQALNILVIQPDPLCHMDRFSLWLNQPGINFSVVEPLSGDKIPTSLSDYDALMVLGGQMGDADDHKYPWLQDIRDLLANATEQQKPTLGVCLGAQLLAAATGGKVEVGSHGLQTGVMPVEKTDAAKDDPLFANVADTFYAGSMHNDTITELPPGATLLGTGKKYKVQAFRKDSSWGVQFHPELSPELYSTWVEAVTADNLNNSDTSFTNTVEDFKKVDTQVVSENSQIARNFINIVIDAKQKHL